MNGEYRHRVCKQRAAIRTDRSPYVLALCVQRANESNSLGSPPGFVRSQRSLWPSDGLFKSVAGACPLSSGQEVSQTAPRGRP